MNEHDMISNISYIMRAYPETTEKILIKHGADPSKKYWTDGCDVASAYDELLQWLNSRYDRNDLETELDYHIQEILGWHDVNEATQLDESNNVMSDQKYISAFLSSVDDPSQFLSARLQKSITVDCYLNTAKFSDGAPVLKYFYRGKFTTLYDRTIGRGRWIIIDPDSYGYVYDAKNSGWLQFQLHSSEHASCLSTSVLKKLSELTGDYSWFDTDTDSNISESVASNIEIPAPYNQYYEFSPNEVNFDELPDAFDHYRELKVVAELYAKEQYEDALANNCLDFCWLVEDEIGKLLLVTTAGLRVYPITLEEVLECVGLNEDSVDWRSRKASVDTIELDSRINRIIKGIDLDGRVPKIMKRHYKPNFVRYDIGIGTVGQREASDYESRVAIPAYEHMRDAFEKQGWKVFFQPSVGMRGNLSWTDFYVQVRIPYSSISNGTNDYKEIQGYVEDAIDEDFDVREPSSVDYGNAISSYYKELTDTIEKYGIRKIGYKRAIGYDGVVNGYKFYFIEASTGTGHYAKELYINGREVNLYQSKESKRSFAYLNEMNQFGILSLVKMLENDNLSGIVYRDVDTLDDYEESLVEDVEMSDAQRLALQELDSCLECGELNAEQHALAYQIQWDINFEDVVLFINGIDIDLKDIEHVEYGDCDETKFDGCYSVTLHNGEVKKYGWHDLDMTGSLTCIDCNEEVKPNSLTESISSWKDLYSYKYQFKLINRSEPNSTFADDALRHAEKCGCVKIYYPLALSTRQLRFIFICKSESDYNRFKEQLSENKILRNLYSVSNLTEFNVTEVEDNLKKILKQEQDRIALNAPVKRRGRPNNRTYKEPSVAIYVDDYSKGSIRIPMEIRGDLHESEITSGKTFQTGDHVYVTVANRQGIITKLIGNDVVEVEFEGDFMRPARTDRYYTSELEKIDMSMSDDEYNDDSEEDILANGVDAVVDTLKESVPPYDEMIEVKADEAAMASNQPDWDFFEFCSELADIYNVPVDTIKRDIQNKIHEFENNGDLDDDF